MQSLCLYSKYTVAGTALNTLYILTNLILPNIPINRYYYSPPHALHFINKGTEAQED